MRAGTHIPVGPSYSTVMPDIDFETYSEAGYEWDGTKWRGVTKTGAGLPAVGAAVYAEHPSTEVICMAYDLKDGLGDRLWVPGMLPPLDLFRHIASGGLLEAWNSSFEYHIWRAVCHTRMGWPALPYHQLRDAMAKSRAHSLPGKLGEAAKVLQAPEQKDPRGDALIRKLSLPRNPTKGDPSTRCSSIALTFEMYEYNRQDIKAEAAVSQRCPDLLPAELDLWLLDQRINFRGVYVDRLALENCIAVVNEATDQYTAELQRITQGAVSTAGEVSKIQKWLATQGVHTSTGALDSDAVGETLARADLPAAARRVLEIRSSLGAASVKKLFAISRRLNADGRLLDLFAFCGADRTGRWAGRGPQPQNLPNSGPKVVKCNECGHVRWAKLKTCRCWAEEATPTDWGIDAVTSALEDISGRNLHWVEQQWGDAVGAVSGCLRGLFAAAPGHDLICSDFSAIEAVVMAFMSGEQWRMDVFNTHGKIYEMGASKITGVPFEEFMRHKAETGQHHPHRKKIGKVSELACFGRDTLVLTNSGWKPITDVTRGDMLHDGIGWVPHGGVADRGKRLTTKVGSATVTPDHKFYTGGGQWATAADLNENSSYLNRAISTAHSLLSEWNLSPPGVLPASGADAAVGLNGATTRTICQAVKVPDAPRAGLRNPQKTGQSTALSAPIKNIGAGYLTGHTPQSPVAPTPIMRSIRRMAAGALQCGRSGYLTVKNGCVTFVRYLGGTLRSQLSTELITTGITLQGTCGLSHIVSSRTTNEAPFGSATAGEKCQPLSSTGSSARSTLGPTLCPENSIAVSPPSRSSASRTSAGGGTEKVYDILNCGPRSRFVIWTDYGPLIAHNSAYGGGLGAWKAFGADAFMTDDEIQVNVKAWRAASPAIAAQRDDRAGILPGFWYGLQEAAYAAVTCPGTCYEFRGVSYGVKDDVLYCRLLSGRLLTYHQPRLQMGTTSWGKQTIRLTYMGWNSNYQNGPIGWMRLDTYGPKLAENVIQAVSRDILAHSMLALDRAGYPIVMHVHDEIVAEVPSGTGSVEEFEKIMGQMPDWCKDWPIRAAGGWRGDRYRKD